MGEHRRSLAIALAVAAGMLATGGGLAVASKSPKDHPDRRRRHHHGLRQAG